MKLPGRRGAAGPQISGSGRAETPVAPPDPPHTGAPPARNNMRGSSWLLADMALNIWALAIVKAMGADFAAVQIVFIRAAIGLILLLPFVGVALWRNRGAGRHSGALRLRQPGLHLLRVGLSTVALTSSFFAVAKVPLALFTAISFTRPVVMMVMAALILREVIRPAHWLAGAVGLLGVVIAVEPAGFATGYDANAGLLALFVTVFTGTGAIIVTRKMRAEPSLIMMLTYTAGLALCTLPFALWFWVPVAEGWRVLIWIGVFSQAAQFCFLRAHYWGDAGVLGPLSYASLILSTAVGYLIFDEVPTPAMVLGAGLIVLATLSISGLPGRLWRRGARRR